MIVLKTPAELDRMRKSGQMVAEVLGMLERRVKPGVTTLELDRLAEDQCRKWKARPAFKGYGGFPFTICASPNDQVVHGFPNSVPLSEGEILSVDFGLIYDGFYGDSAITFPVGEIADSTRLLLEVTKRSLEEGIASAVSGGRLSDISNAVQKKAESAGFGVVREFVGHGIGTRLHEDPQIPNYGLPGKGPKLKPGMTLAIEPMVNAGSPAVRVLEDGWTAVTLDGCLSAHFEHTVAITEQGPEILTRL